MRRPRACAAGPARRRWRCSGPARGRWPAGSPWRRPRAAPSAPGPSPSTTRRTPGSCATVASRLSTFFFSSGPTWPTTSWPPSGECTRAQRSWRCWSRSPGWWCSRSTPGFQVLRVQHDGRYAEPLGRLGGLDAEPARVDEVADVGAGQRHRLADGADRGHPAGPEDPGAAEVGLAAAVRRTRRRRGRRRPSAADDLAGDARGGDVAGEEVLGDQCDAHASNGLPTACPGVTADVSGR